MAKGSIALSREKVRTLLKRGIKFPVPKGGTGGTSSRCLKKRLKVPLKGGP